MQKNKYLTPKELNTYKVMCLELDLITSKLTNQKLLKACNTQSLKLEVANLELQVVSLRTALTRTSEVLEAKKKELATLLEEEKPTKQLDLEIAQKEAQEKYAAWGEKIAEKYGDDVAEFDEQTGRLLLVES